MNQPTAFNGLLACVFVREQNDGSGDSHRERRTELLDMFCRTAHDFTPHTRGDSALLRGNLRSEFATHTPDGGEELTGAKGFAEAGQRRLSDRKEAGAVIVPSVCGIKRRRRRRQERAQPSELLVESHPLVTLLLNELTRIKA